VPRGASRFFGMIPVCGPISSPGDTSVCVIWCPLCRSRQSAISPMVRRLLPRTRWHPVVVPPVGVHLAPSALVGLEVWIMLGDAHPVQNAHQVIPLRHTIGTHSQGRNRVAKGRHTARRGHRPAKVSSCELLSPRSTACSPRRAHQRMRRSRSPRASRQLDEPQRTGSTPSCSKAKNRGAPYFGTPRSFLVGRHGLEPWTR
jgi:hypothetical protein